MRQRRWVELMVYYDLALQYQPPEGEIVPDALSGNLLS